MSEHHPDRAPQPDPPGPPAPGATGPAAAASRADVRARDAAVDEARAVLATHWPRWAATHDMAGAPRPATDEPRVTLVGEHAENFHYVAVLHFGFVHAGRAFAGIARGPAASPTFRVWLLGEPERDPDPRWWRRLRGAGRAPRHRASTVLP